MQKKMQEMISKAEIIFCAFPAENNFFNVRILFVGVGWLMSIIETISL